MPVVWLLSTSPIGQFRLGRPRCLRSHSNEPTQRFCREYQCLPVSKRTLVWGVHMPRSSALETFGSRHLRPSSQVHWLTQSKAPSSLILRSGSLCRGCDRLHKTKAAACAKVRLTKLVTRPGPLLHTSRGWSRAEADKRVTSSWASHA